MHATTRATPKAQRRMAISSSPALSFFLKPRRSAGPHAKSKTPGMVPRCTTAATELATNVHGPVLHPPVEDLVGHGAMEEDGAVAVQAAELEGVPSQDSEAASPALVVAPPVLRIPRPIAQVRISHGRQEGGSLRRATAWYLVWLRCMISITHCIQ